MYVSGAEGTVTEIKPEEEHYGRRNWRMVELKKKTFVPDCIGRTEE